MPPSSPEAMFSWLACAIWLQETSAGSAATAGSASRYFSRFLLLMPDSRIMTHRLMLFGAGQDDTRFQSSSGDGCEYQFAIVGACQPIHNGQAQTCSRALAHVFSPPESFSGPGKFSLAH